MMPGPESQWISKALLEEKALVPASFYSWIFSSNLCQTIIDKQYRFSLDVLEQGFGLIDRDEQDLLKVDNPCFIRKVLISGDQNPLIFARVIIPETVFKAYQTIIESLGNSPIGNSFLYQDKSIKRQDFVFKLIKGEEKLFSDFKSYIQSGVNPAFWARRSVFILPEGALLITEVFLNL